MWARQEWTLFLGSGVKISYLICFINTKCYLQEKMPTCFPTTLQLLYSYFCGQPLAFLAFCSFASSWNIICFFQPFCSDYFDMSMFIPNLFLLWLWFFFSGGFLIFVNVVLLFSMTESNMNNYFFMINSYFFNWGLRNSLRLKCILFMKIFSKKVNKGKAN